MTVHAGVEITVDWAKKEHHLLGYFPDSAWEGKTLSVPMVALQEACAVVSVPLCVWREECVCNAGPGVWVLHLHVPRARANACAHVRVRGCGFPAGSERGKVGLRWHR